jgi:hypothetical protein
MFPEACNGTHGELLDGGEGGEGGRASDECEKAKNDFTNKGANAAAARVRFDTRTRKVADKFKIRAGYDAILRRFNDARRASLDSGQVNVSIFENLGRELAELLISSGHRDRHGDIPHALADATRWGDRSADAVQAGNAAKRACQGTDGYEDLVEKPANRYAIGDQADQAFIDAFAAAVNAFIGQ